MASKKRLRRRRWLKIHFWLKRQLELRNRPVAVVDPQVFKALTRRAWRIGKENMELYLDKTYGPVPFYMNFRIRKVLKKQPNAIELLGRIKLAEAKTLSDQIIAEILGEKTQN